MHADDTISGYTYGRPQVSTSPVSMDVSMPVSMPVSMEELRQLESAVGWSDDDAAWLRQAAEALVPQAEQMVDSWREAIGRQPHLLASFLKPDGQPDDAYKAAVKRRFVQWVSDLCLRAHDQQWLDYQEEIGLRHTPAKKNRTDGGHTPSVVPLRYTVGFAAVIVTSVRPFLAQSGRPANELDRMQAAWTRAVLLSIALWSRAYTAHGLW